jgi:hypothetical protein
LPGVDEPTKKVEVTVLPALRMSRRLLTGTVVALMACERSSTAPTEVGAAPRPKFSVVTNQTDRPFAFNLNGCSERVHVSGTFHVLLTSTVSESGETTDRFHINADGTGLGLTSGAAYSVHEVINATDHGRDGTPRVSSGNDTEVLHGEGDVPDLFFRQHYQFTVNANGEVTVDFNNIESTCS